MIVEFKKVGELTLGISVLGALPEGVKVGNVADLFNVLACGEDYGVKYFSKVTGKYNEGWATALFATSQDQFNAFIEGSETLVFNLTSIQAALILRVYASSSLYRQHFPTIVSPKADEFGADFFVDATAARFELSVDGGEVFKTTIKSGDKLNQAEIEMVMNQTPEKLKGLKDPTFSVDEGKLELKEVCVDEVSHDDADADADASASASADSGSDSGISMGAGAKEMVSVTLFPDGARGVPEGGSTGEISLNDFLFLIPVL